MRKIITTAALGIALAAGSLASAAEVDVDEKAMARKTRSLGVTIGNAYSCTPEKERNRFNEQAHHLFDLIVQDVGSDLAFVYATGLGRGAARAKEKLDCPKLLESWEEIREDYELKGDG